MSDMDKNTVKEKLPVKAAGAVGSILSVNNLKRLMIVIVSIYCMTLSFGLFYYCALGSDPMSVLVEGISVSFTIPYGTASNILNISMFAIVLLFGRNYIGIATVIAAFMTGTFLNWNVAILNFLLPGEQLCMAARYILPVIATVVNTASIGCYIAMSLGTSPFDGIVLLVKSRLKISYKKSMYVINCFLFLSGIALRGTWGYATVIYLLFSGFFFELFINYFAKKFGDWIKG